MPSKEALILFEEALKSYVQSRPAGTLKAVFAYGLFPGGKRVRPKLVFEAGAACAPGLTATELAEYCMPAALAVELVHNYSLMHDDLPAMDDDDERRGKPSIHKVFGEAAAILGGDALLSDAFMKIAGATNNVAKQCEVLARCIGSEGMCHGQMLDMEGDDEESLLEANELKTARLFQAACELGALSVSAPEDQVKSLNAFGKSLGLAFQLVDDKLDMVQSADNELAKLETQKAHKRALDFGDSGKALAGLAKALLKRAA